MYRFVGTGAGPARPGNEFSAGRGWRGTGRRDTTFAPSHPLEAPGLYRLGSGCSRSAFLEEKAKSGVSPPRGVAISTPSALLLLSPDELSRFPPRQSPPSPSSIPSPPVPSRAVPAPTNIPTFEDGTHQPTARISWVRSSRRARG